MILSRREFVGLLGCAATTPIFRRSARAQQPPGKVVRIGLLHVSRNENHAAFIDGLRDAGYVDGQNAQIETRLYGAMLDRIAELANELVATQCNVIVATAPYAIRATKSATSTIPIVAVDLESDPVASGWAASLARPGGNLTGFFLDMPELGGKQIALLKEATPTLSRLAILWDSTIGAVQFDATQAAARAAGVQVHSAPIQRSADIDGAIGRAASAAVHGMVVLSSPLILTERVRIAEGALKARLPTISLFTLFPRSGGLMAYGPNLPGMFKRMGILVDRLLKGAAVGEMPIERPTRFDLVVNHKTATMLGLTIPATLLVRADEVIE